MQKTYQATNNTNFINNFDYKIIHKMTSTINSNNVLLQVNEDTRKKIYYFPGYLRMKVKNFVSMDLENLNSEVNADLIFTVFYGNVKPVIVE